MNAQPVSRVQAHKFRATDRIREILRYRDIGNGIVMEGLGYERLKASLGKQSRLAASNLARLPGLSSA